MKVCRCEAVETYDKNTDHDFYKVAQEIINFAIRDAPENNEQNSAKEIKHDIASFIEKLYKKHKKTGESEESNFRREIKKCMQHMKTDKNDIREKTEFDDSEEIAILENKKLEEMERKFYEQQRNLQKKDCYNNNKIYYPVKKTDKNLENVTGPGKKL